MSWQESELSRTVIGDVPETAKNSSVPDPNTLVDEDAQVDRKTKQNKAESEQEAHGLQKTSDLVAEDDTPSLPVTAKADISSESKPSSQRAAEASGLYDIEQLEQRYVDLQTQAARLYCLWTSDLSPEIRRMRLQEAIEMARTQVELGRETIISAKQRSAHRRI